jgi:hypothetical protein
LSEALCDLYCGYIERSVRELRPDGFWTSDDLSPFCRPKTGIKSSLFVRPELFREFMKPYYARIGAVCREQGVHWWLHSCGNKTDIMGDLEPGQKVIQGQSSVYGRRIIP